MDQQHRRRRVRPVDGEALMHTPPNGQTEQEAKELPEQLTSAPYMQQDSSTAGRRRRRAQQPQSESPAQREARAEDEEKNEQAPDNEVFWHPESEPIEPKPQRPAQRKSPLEALAALDAVICRMGDSCLHAIKWGAKAALSGARLALKAGKRAIRSARKALRSTGSAASSRVHIGPRISAQAQKAAPQEEAGVTLEPIRPDEYRGMGQLRADGGRKPAAHKGKNKRVVRAPGKRKNLMYSAMMACFVCVALVSAYMVGSIVHRSISTKMLSDSLSKRYSELSDAQEEQTAEPGDGFEIYTGEEMPVFSPEDSPFPYVSPTPQFDMLASSLAAAEEESVPKPRVTPAPKKENVVKTTKFHQVGGEPLPEMEALYQDNRDLIGWLRMEGILDLPVVYRDNEYYLKRDFYKNKSASGTLFLDENHPFRENSQNLLLHGHNMKDGTMFGRLVQYETNLQFLKNNPFIQYSTLWKKEQYVIFAVLHVSLDLHSPDFFNYYTHHTFSSDKQFESYVRSLQNRSVFSIPVDVEPSDALLTLSTCLDEDRLVIVARRLREGESKSSVRQTVQLAAKQ